MTEYVNCWVRVCRPTTGTYLTIESWAFRSEDLDSINNMVKQLLGTSWVLTTWGENDNDSKET